MFTFGNYNILQAATFFLASFVAVLLINMFAILIAKKFGVADNPNGDKLKIHKKITPLSGGIGLFLIIVAILVGQPKIVSSQLTFTVSVFAVFVLGLLDDKYKVTPLVRILIHASLAIAIYLSLFYLSTYSIVFLIISTLIFVGTIVAINMIDGMDGICTGLSFTTACGFLVLSLSQQMQFSGLLSFAVAIFSIVFLLFNFKPAKAFLGSTGSELLGFLFAFLALSISKGDIIRFIILIAMVGIPIIDLLRVMIIRFRNQKPLMAGDRNHIFDWMKTRGLNQIQIWGILFVTQIILVAFFSILYTRII